MFHFLCPRRDENPFPRVGLPESDSWRVDDSCSYCGSLNPDLFMSLIEAGAASLTPTDKNYKVYAEVTGRGTRKFYFQHLSEDQKMRFIELMNEKKLEVEYPGYFYRLPYFIRYKDRPEN